MRMFSFLVQHVCSRCFWGRTFAGGLEDSLLCRANQETHSRLGLPAGKQHWKITGIYQWKSKHLQPLGESGRMTIGWFTKLRPITLKSPSSRPTCCSAAVFFSFLLSFRKRSCCCRKAALVFPSARVRAAQSKQEDGDLGVWTGSQNNLLKTQRAMLGWHLQPH